MKSNILFVPIFFTGINSYTQSWINEVTISPSPIKECDSIFIIIDGNMPSTNCLPTLSYSVELNEIIVDVNIECPGIGGPAITTYEETIALGLLFSNDYTLIVNQYLDNNLQETNTSSFTVENCCDSIVADIEQTGNSIEITNIQNATYPYTFHWNNGETTQSITPNYNGLFWAVVTDSNNCFSDTLMFDVNFVGIDFIPKYISIYPNPSQNRITIGFNNFNGKIQTSMFDCIGNLLLTTLDRSINIESFAKGVYILKITIDNNTLVRNIIKN